MSISSNNEIIIFYYTGVLKKLELKISLLEKNSNIYILFTNKMNFTFINLLLILYSTSSL